MSLKSSSRVKKRRSGELWTSSNRVLNGTGSKNLGRNPNFDTEETKLLIQLWGDPKVQRTLITSHKKHAVICQLSTKMQDYGYFRSAEEITTRIKNLKCFYNRLKKEMEASPNGNMEPTWRHYAEMDAIMTRPIFSVRPNEVPAPSLKYQLEKKQEERQERKRKALEEGKTGTLSDSEEDLEDMIALSKLSKHAINKDKEIDDGIIPDVEIDFDIGDEAFVALANAAEKTINQKSQKFMKANSDGESSCGSDEHDDADEDRLCIKEEEFESIDTDIPDEEKKEEQKPAIHGENSDGLTDMLKIHNQEANNNNHNDRNDSISCDNTNDSCVALVIPKDEPIDVDAEDDDDNVKETPSTNTTPKMMSTIGEMLKLSQNNVVAISSSGNILIPVSNMTTSSTNSMTKAIASISNAIPTSRILTSTTSHTQQAKISLVPTNFLMQPKSIVTNSSNVASANSSTPTTLTMPSLHLLQGQMSNARILSGAGTNTGIVTTGPGGMKVLLVNAEQATSGKHTLATTNLNIGKTVLPLGAQNILQQTKNSQHQHQHQHHNQSQQQQRVQIQQQQHQHQHQHQQHHHQEKDILKKRQSEREKLVSKREELFNKREATGVRILMRQLLNAQIENNEIEKKRLTLERERFEFEKNIAERFLSALPGLLISQQPTQQPQQQFFIQQSGKSQTANMPQTAQLRLNPPKLVFATAAAMPTASAVTTTSVNNAVTVLATSLGKDNVDAGRKAATTTKNPIEICTQINDFQLLTPKEENEE